VLRTPSKGVPVVDTSVAVLGIRDILVRIRLRIPGSVPLTHGSGSGSPDPTPFFIDFKDAKRNIFLYFFLITCVKMLVWRHYFSPLNTFMEKREGSGSVPLTNGSGSRVCKPEVADSHHLDKEQSTGPDPQAASKVGCGSASK
jgi:hypothetical protein